MRLPRPEAARALFEGGRGGLLEQLAVGRLRSRSISAGASGREAAARLSQSVTTGIVAQISSGYAHATQGRARRRTLFTPRSSGRAATTATRT